MSYARLIEIELFDHLYIIKWLMFNWIVSDIAVLGTICFQWVMLNRIISVKKQYLKFFNSVPKLKYWYNIAIHGMDVQEWDDQHEHTYSNYVRTQDVTLKTCRRRWMIGRNGERGSRISALAVRHDDDDDDANEWCWIE